MFLAFLAVWDPYGAVGAEREKILHSFFIYNSYKWYWGRLSSKIWFILTFRNYPYCHTKLNARENRVIRNFIQIEQKTQKLEIFTCGRFRLVGLVGRKMVVGILNSFYVVFTPLLASIPNFIQIGWKTWKLEIFTFGRSWLVGLVGRKMVAATSNVQLPSGRL